MVCGDQHSPHDPHGSPFRPRFLRRLAQSLHDPFMIFYKAIRRGCQPPPPWVAFFYSFHYLLPVSWSVRDSKSTNHGKIIPHFTELKSIFHGILQKPFVFQWIVSIFVPYDQRQIRYGRLPLEALIFPPPPAETGFCLIDCRIKFRRFSAFFCMFVGSKR